MGSVTQIRVLGGTIGLAICSALFNNQVRSEISEFLTPTQMAGLLRSFKSIEMLPVEAQGQVRDAYAVAYNQQMRVMLYFCLAALPSLLLLAEKKPRRGEFKEDGELVDAEE